MENFQSKFPFLGVTRIWDFAIKNFKNQDSLPNSLKTYFSLFLFLLFLLFFFPSCLFGWLFLFKKRLMWFFFIKFSPTFWESFYQVWFMWFSFGQIFWRVWVSPFFRGEQKAWQEKKKKKKSRLFGGHGTYQAQLFLRKRARHFEKWKCVPPDSVRWLPRITFSQFFPWYLNEYNCFPLVEHSQNKCPSAPPRVRRVLVRRIQEINSPPLGPALPLLFIEFNFNISYFSCSPVWNFANNGGEWLYMFGDLLCFFVCFCEKNCLFEIYFTCF